MGVVYQPESPLMKEMARWNKPYQFHPFPSMVYRGHKTADGRVLVHDTRGTSAADSFTASCQKIVHSEDELARAKNEGWSEGPEAALEKARDIERGISTAEAERFAAEVRMTEVARREAKERDGALSDGDHVPELPPVPVRPRTRAPKRGSHRSAA